MKRIPHDGSALLWSALILAASAVSAGCSTSHESSGGDGGGPPSSCPATFTDAILSSRCSPPVTCDYYGQINCACVNVVPSYGWQWQCIQYPCICISSDAGPGTFTGDASPSCVNEACNTNADCPSGQHCGAGVGPGITGSVCSVGCEGDAGQNGHPNGSCPFGGTCETITATLVPPPG